MSRWTWGTRLIVVLLAALGLGSAVAKAENYAFLVAVQDYDVKDLKKLNYTRNDIEQFAALLKESGFKAENIVLMTDNTNNRRFLAESERIRKQLGLLLATLKESDTLVVAFSGHGVQFEGDAKNYYCPADADLEDPKRSKLIAVSEIYDRLKECPAERKLLLVDACRNDPLSPIKKSRDTVKLKSVTRPQLEVVPKGVVALFSCSAGQESYEWPELKHGIFFHHGLDGWKGAAADGDQQVTLNGLVAYATAKTQTFARVNLDALQSPQLKSDFEGTWVLRKVEQELKQEITNSIGMKLRLIPKGTFTMGSPASEEGHDQDEEQHRVTITKAFYLGKYEVTQGEWKAIMETEPWKGKSYIKEGEEYPAAYVSWDDAVDFCKKLSRKERKEYRLPTEAEWEHACRGGKTTRYSFGDDESDLGDYAWYDKNAEEVKEEYAHRVGQKRANPFGLHDMHGNVREWCSDWYDAKYNASSPAKDPSGPDTGSYRVYRGGSWNNWPVLCRSAYRFWYSPSYRFHFLGFRLALSSKE